MPQTVSAPKTTRSRANMANWHAMRWLEAEIQQRGLSLREVARRMGHQNATRVREYLNQRIVPGPAVLSNLAIAVGVSPIEALWLAGRREAVFDYLHALYQLGWGWMRKDRLHLDQENGADFMGYYIARANGKPIRTKTDLRVVPRDLRSRYHQADIYNYAGLYTHVSLPKPMACAILLAVGLFPRRGERVHEQARAFIKELGFIAVSMLPAAERMTVPKELLNQRRPLDEAKKILPLRFYGKMRLAIVGEYAHAWADFICKAYADYARIVLYEGGSFIGEVSGDENLWEWQRTTFPTASDFAANG